MADKVKNIPSSFVKNNFKLKTDTGSGEAKFYLDQKSRESYWDTYFDFGGEVIYQFDQANLLDYLNKVKLEYIYHGAYRYTAVDLATWQDAYNYVSSCTSFQFELDKFISGNRYYIRPKDGSTSFPNSATLWNHCLRELPLPLLTNLEITKVGNNITFTLGLELGASYGKVPTTLTTYSCNDYPFNRIVFGAPGTGKSHTLEEDATALLSSKFYLERVTFYQDYSYSKFFGTYKPVSNNGVIDYVFVAGPFMKTYVKALMESLKADPQPCLLLIEEINRANPAAVFGDTFQLLDRMSDNRSKYPISPSKDVQDYLCSIFGGEPSDYDELRIPNNMYIWSTMNSADQGVFPMDTAFKRRWDYQYIGINDNDSALPSSKISLGIDNYKIDIEWNKLRKAINNKLLDVCKVNEDKLIGPFFIDKEILQPISTDNSEIKKSDEFIKIFKSKVLMYLFEDAGKLCRNKLFEDTDSRKYSSICDEFNIKGIAIFGEKFRFDYYDKV